MTDRTYRDAYARQMADRPRLEPLDDALWRRIRSEPDARRRFICSEGPDGFEAPA